MWPGSISAKDMLLAIFGRKPGQRVHDSLQGLGQSPIFKIQEAMFPGKDYKGEQPLFISREYYPKY
jgi:hypothetical protein